MMNYMLPQAAVNHTDAQIKNFFNSLIESNHAYIAAQVKTFDQLTGNTFNLHTSRTLETLKDVVENAKQTVKTGKIAFPFKG